MLFRSSAQLTDELRFLRHRVAASIFAITRGVGCVNGFAMELGDENMQDGIEHRLWRAFKEIREADEDASLAQSNRAIDVGETIEADLELGYRRTRTQIAICLFKNLEKGGHLEQKPAANAREPTRIVS